jgi:SAM-dependent methyltransferase
MLYLLLILQVILLVIFFITFLLFILWTIGIFINRVPFITTSSSILKDIKEALDINDDSVIYDLGCGDGRILFYLSSFNKKAKYIGIENSLFPILLAWVGNLLNKRKNGVEVKIINSNFFNEDLSQATHIFTYLYPNVMDELLPKLKKELKPGVKLISLSFKFSFKSPTKEIDLKRKKYKLGRKMYIYQF